ncbi:GNAT family N-acetyltransferase [Paenibacillus thiaminolyticus]|uniref:GNAT family N-acetyltransferase n=1 Tax=Paenibacillus thiaminolyticus TaxID=49283 RepID=UPI00116226DC|nr:GNAT family protein [Paenibacillus thiaminolyticus]NGP57406.1 GNAT family N-acetyltransferase [Paenibacillus thiaminolyticus]WCR27403.1 GNAT family N-acetyltransferase [Paenibacillus thiaminolyticus]
MIALQYFVPSDFQQLISWSGDDAFLLQWAGPEFKYPLTEDQLLEYIKGANDVERSHRLIYKAIETETNQTVGHISIGRIERYNRSARIGKVLIGNKSSRGKGYGTQIMQQALRIGFEELQLHRISLGVFVFNESARRCYEKLGFVQEGVTRDARRYQDSYWSLIEMSILEDEWRNMKSLYE